MVYFIAGYFYEIEDEIVKHPAAQWLAQLGNGKGKVTPHFILKGIAKVIQFLEVQEVLNKSKENEQMLQKNHQYLR